MNLKTYIIVTGAYWAYTLTDGALRMLVLLHFHDLGFSPLTLAALFLPYELVGVVTNLVGGWLGARHGLNRTLVTGLGLQSVSLFGLSVRDDSWTLTSSVVFVMALQALSGVAKDLTKMSSKSAVKLVVGDGSLFRLVALLTGSKNALKGVGFFVGAGLLGWLGYRGALYVLGAIVLLALCVVLFLLDDDLGSTSTRTSLRAIFSKAESINRLSAARVFLFGARDIWFVVALPVFFDEQLGWSFGQIGGFLAVWVIGYGVVQSLVPRVRGSRNAAVHSGQPISDAKFWALVLALLTVGLAVLVGTEAVRPVVVIAGLLAFGVVFAFNSSLHSYLILAYSRRSDVALDVGFYYSANAVGRLVGTGLSGLLFVAGGLTLALVGSAAFTVCSWMLTLRLPPIAPADSADVAPS